MLNPAMKSVLEDLVANPAPAPQEVYDPDCGVVNKEALAAMRANAIDQKRVFNQVQLEDVRWLDWQCPGRSGPIAMRTYHPSHEAHATPLVSAHGGGWVVCDLNTHHGLHQRLCQATGRVVHAVGYRLAPENPYPAAEQDCVDALAFLGEVSKQERRPSFVLHGDSAGAHLVLKIALNRPSRMAQTDLAGLILSYGCFRRRFDTASHHAFGDGRFGLTTARMRLFWSLYAGSHARGLLSAAGGHCDPCLGSAQFDGLPPTLVHVAQCDPLADDSAWLAARLSAQGVPVESVVWDGLIHGYLHYWPRVPAAERAFDAMAAWLDRLTD